MPTTRPTRIGGGLNTTFCRILVRRECDLFCFYVTYRLPLVRYVYNVFAHDYESFVQSIQAALKNPPPKGFIPPGHDEAAVREAVEGLVETNWEAEARKIRQREGEDTYVSDSEFQARSVRSAQCSVACWLGTDMSLSGMGHVGVLCQGMTSIVSGRREDTFSPSLCLLSLSLSSSLVIFLSPSLPPPLSVSSPLSVSFPLSPFSLSLSAFPSRSYTS